MADQGSESAGPEPSTATPGSRIVGCASFLLVLAAFPVAVVGGFLYLEASTSVGGGPMAGLGPLVGLALIALAAVAFGVGAFMYVWSAKD